MTAPTTLPGAPPSGTDDDDEGEHLYHCDPNRSLCGVDITDYEDVTGLPVDEKVCPWCQAVYKLRIPCGPGCGVWP